ncbi:hypothetical protein KZP23_04240 [Echinicola marina]|uniref:hypothetical protein n=1 Tax=Echinicola marina TaxID=2859768 RepID=UPI001CF65B63|nr:hypothetical protein [Echinicola marina]UCS94249.1 hypothetical protein KZP23_04240 [Echinicola marina]
MKNLPFIFLVIFLALFYQGKVYGQSCNCHPVNDLTITISDSDNGSHDAAGKTNVCIEGAGTFSGTITNLSVGAIICIDEEVTYEFSSAITDNSDPDWGQIWPGTWTINNYGKFIGNTVITIQDGQVFNNYSYGDYEGYGDVDADLLVEAGFYIRPGGEGRDDNDQINIVGEFNNYGSINVSGDIINDGEFISGEGAITNVGNEFHNESGFTETYSILVYGEITNTGTINLGGVMESVIGGFANQRNSDSGTVVTINSCALIRTAGVINGNGGVYSQSDEVNNLVLYSYSEEEDRYDEYFEGEPEEFVLNGELLSEGDACFSILPVEWNDFLVELLIDAKEVKIHWSTSKEWENSHFEIERSIDGVGKYQVIGRVDAVGWSDLISYYSYKDTELPIYAERLYYRIRQMDLDGSYSYSKTLLVEMPEINYKYGVWKAFPNPTKGEILNLILAKKEQYDGEVINFRIFNTLNASDYKKVNSLVELNQNIAETVRDFSNGLVVIELRWGENVEYIKVINR